MAAPTIQFNDGAAYDRMMGVWSRMVGEVFLDWLAPAPGLTWTDIGCGSGAFSELIAARCAPSEIQGIDPSEGQLAFARTRPAAHVATYRQGDAMALPYANNSLDVAAMALVLFFVPDATKGVAEMVRVVRPGGLVSAYVWDILEGGAPLEPIHAEMRARGVTPPLPPSAAVSRMEALHAAWAEAGLEAIETRVITARRSFADFEAFWSITTSGSSLTDFVASLGPESAAALKAGVKARMQATADGTITYEARANAIKGRKPI